MIQEKRCSHCGLIKQLDDFYNAANGLLGKMSECAACNKAKKAIYRQNNREKERIRNRIYGAANKELVKNRVERWRKSNPGKERAKRRMREVQKLRACPPWAQKGAVKKRNSCTLFTCGMARACHWRKNARGSYSAIV